MPPHSQARRVRNYVLVGMGALVLGGVVLQVSLSLGLSPAAAAVPTYAAGTFWTWQANRRFTFRPGALTLGREFLAYFGTSAAGILVNVSVYLIALAGGFHPFLALLAGAAVGALFNFLGYDRLVFARRA